MLASVSTTSLAGGKLYASQGRNLKRIVEELRKHCYLKLDEAGRPAQVVQIVDAERYCFARCECGMSPATFYRALEHPLAHLFLRTQKVQREEEGAQARRNVATLFTVALYKPEMPVELETEFWAEQVQQGDIFFAVLDSNSQDDGTKGSPLIRIPFVSCRNRDSSDSSTPRPEPVFLPLALLGFPGVFNTFQSETV
ncbi:hypothetical protein HLB42_20660 (plasmid) [Deinococcus sp. D7000]|nr:hypothetical protein HLB42_20660 [Deinococcus sp. D7000]